MPQYINSNIPSLNAQRNLNSSQNALQTSLQRLSSGMRINSAKDDAAGLAIADRFTSQIRGLNQATRNANDGISLAQTAEGSLGEITNNLQRLRELAVQSANSTNSDSDRAALQQEAGQLLSEIDRSAKASNFNGTKLLDGSFKGSTFQVGANVGETISVSLNGATTDKLGVSNAVSVSSMQTANAFGTGDLIINGTLIGPSLASSDHQSFNTSTVAASAIAKAAAINAKSADTGVTATVDKNVAEGVDMSAGASFAGTIVINGVTTATFAVNASDRSAGRAAAVQAINAISGRTGVTAVDTGLDTAGVQLVAADGRNITVTNAGSANNGIMATGHNYGSISLSSSNDIVISSSTNTLGSNAGFVAGTYKTQEASVSTVSGNASALASGDISINGVLVGASRAADDTASTANKSFSAIAKVAAINRISEQSGVTATVNATRVTGSGAGGGAGTIRMVVNGVTTATFVTVADSSTSRSAAVQAINAISGRTGVTAVDDGNNGVSLVAADGRNIVTTFMTGTASNAGLAGAGSTYGTYALHSASAINISAGTTAVGTGVTNSGLSLGTYGSTKTGSSLKELDISTVAGANKALTAIDNALKQIDENRSTLGAVQNRFSSTLNTLATNSENLTAARSRIQDADFASETASLSKNQILQQAGTAMLAQANQLSQGVLSLLR